MTRYFVHLVSAYLYIIYIYVTYHKDMITYYVIYNINIIDNN